MVSRAESPPTAAELLVWVGVAAPASARGVFRSEAVQDVGFSWFAAEPPVFVDVPPAVGVRFWHRAPDSWRLEVGGELLAVSDGRRAAAWTDEGVRVGATLLMPSGPAALLRPGRFWGGYDESLPSRPVPGIERDDRLGRRAWRWHSQGTTSWVDEETGCCLRREGSGGSLALDALDVGVDIDDALFTVPDIDPADVAEGWPSPDEHEDEVTDRRTRVRPRADFTVTWWPWGARSFPRSGDASVPEVLLVLDDGEDAPFHLGVAPTGRRPPTVPGCRTREWTGKGWGFALSWSGDVDGSDVDRIVESVPEEWR